MSDVMLYGIKNCDTVKKARKWLEQNGINYRFHDVRADGLSLEKIQHWLDKLGAEALVNKRSTTWKSLDKDEQAQALEAGSAAALLQDKPTLIKRPVLETGAALHLGFKAEHYQTLFSS